jgi:hypothetical protein
VDGQRQITCGIALHHTLIFDILQSFEARAKIVGHVPLLPLDNVVDIPLRCIEIFL